MTILLSLYYAPRFESGDPILYEYIITTEKKLFNLKRNFFFPV